jgi:outer membrane receptor protein involved in Fe transport
MNGVVFTSLLILVGVNSMLAQTTGKIAGKVTDEVTGEALAGCNVVVVGTTLGAATDVEGSYFILNVPAAKYDVQASYLGYQRVLQRDVIVNSGRTTVADFKLKASALQQQEVVIEATRPDVERDKTSTSTVIRADEVGQIAGMRDIGDVIGLAADVTDGHFRGGRANEEYYTLQGMGIVNPLDASAAFRPILSAVEEVDVITSGFDAQYGNAQSGVVNITMKEGKSDKWSSRLEARVRAPGLKYFGPSVYDQNANPYLLKLADPNFWLHGDSTSGNYPPLGWTSTAFGGDTAVMSQVAQSIWKSATKQDLNSKYWKSQVDYSIEGATGGPLADGIRMFVALRSEVENQIVPTEEPDKQQQLMGNVVFDLGKGTALRLSGGYQYEFNNILGGGTNFYQWVWDRILGESYQEKINAQFGARFTQALSSSTFYDIKLNGLRTTSRLGTSPYYDTITRQVLGTETGTGVVQRTMNFMYYQGLQKTFFYLGNQLSNFSNDATTTISLDASYTSQITKSHLLNGGIQANYYDLHVDDIGSIAQKGSITQRQYKANPYQLGAYIQDKMEFEGMIAKVGLRWDLWGSNSDFYSNQFDPFAVTDSLGNISNNPALSPKKQSKPVGRLQPRVGVSFPVTTSTVFHLNYGTFMQNPSFQYVLGSQQRPQLTASAVLPATLGNPQLKPQVTNQYDIGVMQGLGAGFTLDVSGYYKDIKDLIEQALYQNQSIGRPMSYNSYFNRDYADVRGFRVQLTKRSGALSGSINYQFSVATGKSSSAANAPVVIIKDTAGVISTDAIKYVPVKDVLLNFDRTHNLIVNIAYSTGDRFGPKIFGVYPIASMTFSTMSFARSGRPYTSFNNPNDINSQRSPAEYNTNMRISKPVRDMIGVGATIYVEIFNLFNNKILNYSYLFNTANKTDQNPANDWYSSYAFNDPRNGIQYWDGQNIGTAYAVDHSFMLYDNSPRSYYFGIAIDF